MRVLRGLVLSVLLPLVIATGTSACANSSGSPTAGLTSASAGTERTRTPGASPTTPPPPGSPTAPEIPEVPASELPEEGRQTLRLIEQGGPFPFRQDGTIFQNREGRLPSEPRAYYREYTVPTPGSRDRGARRIIAGKEGERYYTGDHYRTFVRVVTT